MSETISRLSSTHLLVRKAGGKFYVISFEQVISRREKQKKLRTGDEVSWKSKNRNERGRGEIIEMGTREKCETVKSSFEKTNSLSGTTNSVLQSASTLMNSMSVQISSIRNETMTDKENLNESDESESQSRLIIDENRLNESDVGFDSSSTSKENGISIVENDRLNESKIAVLAFERNQLLREMKQLKNTWMPRPTHPETIKYIIEMGKLLSATTDNELSGDASDASRTTECCEILGINIQNLETLRKPHSITRTCRAIINHLYTEDERLAMKWRDIESEKQRAILNLAHSLNPEAREKDVDLVKACRNVFEYTKSKRRRTAT